MPYSAEQDVIDDDKNNAQSYQHNPRHVPRQPGIRAVPGLRSKLVRQMLAEVHTHLRRMHTPAYDPDTNRLAWLWRWSRREVTHHQRTAFAALLEDIDEHCEPLRQHPHLVLWQIGSPFADQGPVA